MSTRSIAAVLLAAVTLAGCAKHDSAAPSLSRGASYDAAPSPATMASPVAIGGVASPGGGAAKAAGEPSSASTPAAELNKAAAFERKIIRNATLLLESKTPDETRAKVQALAEGKGGFVLSSDVSSSSGSVTVKIVVRVPAAHFPGMIAGLHGVGARVVTESQTGQDVTDEFYDLEARLRSQRAVEAQYLEILKKAVTIRETLDVQQKLGEIRMEIERAEGRRRLLENQASLSTITISIVREAPPQIPYDNSFSAKVSREIKSAVNDAGEVAMGIVTGSIRLFGVLLPIALMIVLPFALMVRFFWRKRAKRLEAERHIWAEKAEVARAEREAKAAEYAAKFARPKAAPAPAAGDAEPEPEGAA